MIIYLQHGWQKLQIENWSSPDLKENHPGSMHCVGRTWQAGTQQRLLADPQLHTDWILYPQSRKSGWKIEEILPWFSQSEQTQFLQLGVEWAGYSQDNPTTVLLLPVWHVWSHLCLHWGSSNQTLGPSNPWFIQSSCPPGASSHLQISEHFICPEGNSLNHLDHRRNEHHQIW